MVETGNVVEDFYIGATHVRICDDYCRDKTKEDVQKILDDIARMVYGPLVAAMEQEELEKAEDRETRDERGK